MKYKRSIIGAAIDNKDHDNILKQNAATR